MRNSTVHLQTSEQSGSGSEGEVLYTVSTSSDLNVTEVYRGDLQTDSDRYSVVPMAKIQHNTIRSDTISWDGEKKKLSAWLKPSQQQTEYTLDVQGTQYLWKSDTLSRVACFPADAADSGPLALYISSRAGPNQRNNQGNKPGVGYLHMTHAGEASRDDLVASLLIVQHSAWTRLDNMERAGPGGATINNVYTKT